MATEGPVIKLERVVKTYALGKTEVRALRGAELTLRRREFAVVLGPSGSGKSTLLNIIGCIDTPTSGSYWLDGRRIEVDDVDRLASVRNEKIGFIFQSFNLIPVLDVRENIEFPLLLGARGRASRADVLKVADQVGLSEFLHHRPEELSGGQRQRVAIARALVTAPEVVLADEPTANLDSTTAAQILDLMEGLNQERGTAFLISTHDPRVMKRARRTLEIRDGLVYEAEAQKS
jgi:putative ABC transport system ATP-binding protein